MATDSGQPTRQAPAASETGRAPVRSRIAEQVTFLGTVVRAPRAVGAIAPTHEQTARLIASGVDPQSGLPVLELGPGTGAITEAILKTGLPQERLYAIEYSASFCRHLQEHYPDAHFFQGDAFDAEKTLADRLGDAAPKTFDCVISGLPLLNFPLEKRLHVFNSALAAMAPGRPFVQFSYGLKSPVPYDPAEIDVWRSSWIFRNLPPARVWFYRRKV